MFLRLIAAAAAVALVATSAGAASQIVYIGSTASGADRGIYVAQLDLANGRLSEPRIALPSVGASFFEIGPRGRRLYAVGRSGKQGQIAAISIGDAPEQLELLNVLPTRGAGPCHVTVDAAGQHALIANYGSGSVEAYRMDSDGRLLKRTGFVQHSGSSVNQDRQQGPHAHSVNLDPGGRFALVADLGTDQLLAHPFNVSDGSLQHASASIGEVAAGSGPRHMAWHPDGTKAYLLNELNATVSVFEFDPDSGQLTDVQTVSALPPGYDGHAQASEILVHPGGKFLYAANRGHDSIALFAIDSGGRIEFVETAGCGGHWPRNFRIDPSGQFLLVANVRSNNVATFRIDQQSGKLTGPTSDQSAPAPMCIRMLSRP